MLSRRSGGAVPTVTELDGLGSSWLVKTRLMCKVDVTVQPPARCGVADEAHPAREHIRGDHIKASGNRPSSYGPRKFWEVIRPGDGQAVRTERSGQRVDSHLNGQLSVMVNRERVLVPPVIAGAIGPPPSDVIQRPGRLVVKAWWSGQLGGSSEELKSAIPVRDNRISAGNGWSVASVTARIQ